MSTKNPPPCGYMADQVLSDLAAVKAALKFNTLAVGAPDVDF